MCNAISLKLDVSCYISYFFPSYCVYLDVFVLVVVENTAQELTWMDPYILCEKRERESSNKGD